MSTAALTKKTRFAAMLAALFIALAGAIAVASVTAQQAWADNNICDTVKEFNECMKSERYRVPELRGGKARTNYIYTKKQISRAKSSNPKVVAVKVVRGSGQRWGLKLNCKKVGKAAVSYVINGKRYKVTINVVKPLKPVANLQIGTHNYTKALAKNGRADAGNYITGAFHVSAAPGWRVVKTEGYSMKVDSFTPRNGVKVPPETVYVCITLKNAKLKVTRDIIVDYC